MRQDCYRECSWDVHRGEVGDWSYSYAHHFLAPGSAIVEKLRSEGFAITEIPARGKDGMVSLLAISVARKHANHVQQIAQTEDPEAFVTTEDVRPYTGILAGLILALP